MLKALDVDVTEVAFDLTTQDYASIVQRAAETSPDAMLVGAADFACPKVMQAIADLALDTTIYMVGSCADAKWIEQVGAEAVDRAHEQALAPFRQDDGSYRLGASFHWVLATNAADAAVPAGASSV